MYLFPITYAILPQICHPRGSPGALPILLFSLQLLALRAAAQDSLSSASPAGGSELFNHVIANQKQGEGDLSRYEFIQRVEKRKTGGDHDPVETKVWRVFPVGTGVDKLPLSADGKPPGAESYRNDLEKLEKYLVWVAQEGPAQKEAYAKAERKRKDRYDLIEATHLAFRFTFVGKERRDDRVLLRYSMAPNPEYKPTSRNSTILTRVRGTLWIDEQSSQLAKVEGTVTEDVSIALFLAKVYKGSHFMQERYEIAPGIWEPAFEQYDFDGRKYWMSFSIHERTFFTNYKQVGPPKEAVEVVRAELSKLRAEKPSL
ncbi:MAG: hypothetical protein WBL63_20100 [Candidatus Acidiferrum sp.]